MGDKEYESWSSDELISKIISYSEDPTKDDELDELVDWLLYSYSPEHDFLLLQENATSLSHPGFLDLVMGKIKTLYDAEIFLEAVNMLSSIEGYEAKISETGAPKVVVQIMSRNVLQQRSQVLGCKILGSLATNAAVRNWIGKIHGISRILEALKAHQKSPEVVVECCNALVNLCYCSKPNKQNFITEKGIEVMVEAITTNKGNSKCVHSCLRVLRNIVSSENIKELQQHVLTREIFVILSDHLVISGIQVNAIWVLINLMTTREELKEHMVETGITQIITQVMDLHRLDKDVQIAGATAFALLLKIARTRTIFFERKGFLALITAMQEHRGEVAVQRGCIKALYRLSFNQIIRDKIGPEVIPEVTKAMKNHPLHGPLQRSAIICLLQLAKHEENKEVIHRDALSLVIQAMKRFEGVEHVHVVARRGVDMVLKGKDETGSPLGGSDNLRNSRKERNEAMELRSEVFLLKMKVEERNNYVSVLEEKIQKLMKSLPERKSRRDIHEEEEKQVASYKVFSPSYDKKDSAENSDDDTKDGDHNQRSRSTSSPIRPRSAVTSMENREYATPKRDKIKSKHGGDSPKIFNATVSMTPSKSRHSRESSAARVTSPRNSSSGITPKLKSSGRKDRGLSPRRGLVSQRAPSPRRRRKEESKESMDSTPSNTTEHRKITRRRHDKHKQDAALKEMEILKKENETLKRKLALQAEQLEKEKKEKKQSQKKLQRLQKNMRDSQRLVYDLQKSTLQGRRDSDQAKLNQKIKRLRKRLVTLEKENADLKKQLNLDEVPGTKTEVKWADYAKSDQRTGLDSSLIVVNKPSKEGVGRLSTVKDAKVSVGGTGNKEIVPKEGIPNKSPKIPKTPLSPKEKEGRSREVDFKVNGDVKLSTKEGKVKDSHRSPPYSRSSK